MRNSPIAAALLVLLGGTYGYVRGATSGEVSTASTATERLGFDGRLRDHSEVIFPLAGKSSDSPRLLAQDAGVSTPPDGFRPKPRGRLVKVHRVTLSWQPSANGLTSGDVVTYNVYRCSDVVSSSCAQINVDPVMTAEYTDERVRSGETYYYATTAVDQNGRQSRISNVVKVVIPFP